MEPTEDPEFPIELVNPDVIISGDFFRRICAMKHTPEEEALLEAVRKAAPPRPAHLPPAGTFPLLRAEPPKEES